MLNCQVKMEATKCYINWSYIMYMCICVRYACTLSQPHTYTPTHALMHIQRGKQLKGNRAIC